MNYQSINYPNGFKKVMQPKPGITPCPQPYPTPIITRPPLQQPYPTQPISPVQRPPMGPMQEMPVPPMTPPMTPPQQQPTTLNLFPVDEGYVRGTIFRGLFGPYRNLEPTLNLPDTEDARMKYEVNKYYFAALEMQFYLDVFPNDLEALRVFNDFRRRFVEAKKDYESRFGALDIASESLEKDWDWARIPFPWVGGI